MSSLLAVDAINRAIGDFLVGLSVQRHANRKAGRGIISDDLNAGNRLAPRPLSYGIKALLSERGVAQSYFFPIRHPPNIRPSSAIRVQKRPPRPERWFWVRNPQLRPFFDLSGSGPVGRMKSFCLVGEAIFPPPEIILKPTLRTVGQRMPEGIVPRQHP